MKIFFVVIGILAVKLKNCQTCKHVSDTIFVISMFLVPLASVF